MLIKRVLFLFAIVLVITANLSVSAMAEKIPFGTDTEVYYESNLSGLDIENAYADAYDKISRIEIFQPYLAKIINRLQIDPGKDIFSWMGRRIRFGIVSTDGKSTINKAIVDYSSHAKARTQLRNTLSKLRVVRTSVEYHLNEKGRLPASIKELGPDMIKTLSLPRGGHITYSRINDKEYLLSIPKGQFADLGLKADEPAFHSLKGFTGSVPKIKRKFHMKNFLLVIDVKDTDACRNFFGKMESILSKDVPGKVVSFKKIVSGPSIIKESKIFSYAFRDKLVLLSDNSKVLEQALVIMEKPEKSILANKVYKDYLRSLPRGAGFSEGFFINMQFIGLTPQMLSVTNKNMGCFIKNLYFIGYSANMDNSRVEGALEIAMNPDNKDCILKEYFKRKNPYEEKIMENLPAGIPMAMAYNLGEVWELAKVIGAHEKSLGDSLKMFQSRFGMLSGMELEADLLKPADGQIALTYHLRDLLLSGLIKDFDKKEVPADVKELRGRRTLSRMFKIHKMPMTFFIQMDNAERAGNIINILRTRGGFKETFHGGFTIYSTDKVAFCAVDRMIMFHTFPSETSLKQYIDKLTLQRKRLGETTNYREFKKGIVGRTLVIQYQDSRWAASLTKGLILLFLPEFEEYAERAGNFKESWSSASIHPGGIRFYFRMFN